MIYGIFKCRNKILSKSFVVLFKYFLHLKTSIVVNKKKEFKAYKIRVKGLVQGVGFRPFIYKLALEHKIKGWVENRNDGVYIHAEADMPDCIKFIEEIKLKAPIASNIQEINVNESNLIGFSEFSIRESKSSSEEITEISPDIAVCDECLEDMKTQDHRINYPFINCTNCGPRFTIIKDLPYDRNKTTMKEFPMCELCRREYTNILDRRFHAQPVACNLCGPVYQLKTKNHETTDLQEIIAQAAKNIDEGKIIAVRGLGGFHIACDAGNIQAVKRLRSRKKREGKPFAVMFKDENALRDYAYISEGEEKLITSWRRPIVLLNAKRELAPDVSVGFKTIGAMLPYMPIHYLLFEKMKTKAIVLTSGNISDEPIVIDNNIAQNHLNEITNTFLLHNRDIYNRTDDSVCFVSNSKPRIIRRSRGYAPAPVITKYNTDGLLATGAELVNCFCLGKGRQAILSQHIGDLKNIETLEFFEESINRFTKMFRSEPQTIVCDLHPDYLSTQWAFEQNKQILQVQHHHAHIASCMAEHKLDEKVIGIALDGVGLGDDGKIWGGEFMIADFKKFERAFHFEYVPQPGGDAANKHPWMMAVSYLRKYFSNLDFLNQLDFIKNVNHDKLAVTFKMLENNINTPLTSSAGRLFDAVSALINLCTESGFHAEAPMRLENIIETRNNHTYDFEIINSHVSFKPMFIDIVNDLLKQVPPHEISVKFHNTVINVIFAVVKKIKADTEINKVVLSGGVFQNQYLLENTENKLKEGGFIVFSHNEVPSNDGGIALGQLMIGAKKRS